MRKGDRVRLTFKTDVYGIIIDSMWDGDGWSVSGSDRMLFLVLHEGNDLIPPKEWYYDYELELVPLVPRIVKCECGADSANSKEHYTWCPKNKPKS